MTGYESGVLNPYACDVAWADTLICHTTMHRNAINFLCIPGHVILWCVEVVPMANANEECKCAGIVAHMVIN